MSLPRVVAGLVTAATIAGCGGGGAGHDEPLGWHGRPALYIPPNLPGDRILTGQVRNTGSAPVTVKVPALRVLDAGGHRVPASAQFIRTFAHGLIFPDLKRRDAQPLVEQRRIGQQVVLKPGASAPIVVSWHQPSAGAPTTLDLGTGSVAIPDDRTARRANG